jgi:hypothetical protein
LSPVSVQVPGKFFRRQTARTLFDPHPDCPATAYLAGACCDPCTGAACQSCATGYQQG